MGRHRPEIIGAADQRLFDVINADSENRRQPFPLLGRHDDIGFRHSRYPLFWVRRRTIQPTWRKTASSRQGKAHAAYRCRHFPAKRGVREPPLLPPIIGSLANGDHIASDPRSGRFADITRSLPASCIKHSMRRTVSWKKRKLTYSAFVQTRAAQTAADRHPASGRGSVWSGTLGNAFANERIDVAQMDRPHCGRRTNQFRREEKCLSTTSGRLAVLLRPTAMPTAPTL